VTIGELQSFEGKCYEALVAFRGQERIKTKKEIFWFIDDETTWLVLGNDSCIL